jgi:hypothetical protein
MPVSIALYPPAAIPWAAFAVIVIVIVVWHLNQGRRLTVRRTPKGNITVVFDTTQKRTPRGAK